MVYSFRKALHAVRARRAVQRLAVSACAVFVSSESLSAGDTRGAESLNLEVAWKRPLGSGYSGVVVADGRVVTAFSSGKDDLVAAFAVADGKELWRYRLDETYKGHDGSQDGPLSTPAIAEGRVFMLSPLGKLVALDATSGSEMWASDIVAEHKAAKPHYGFTATPLLVDGVLIVEAGAKGAMVVGLDPKSGKKLWSAGDDEVSYQSPVLRREGSKVEVVAVGEKKLFGVDPKSGKVAWEYAHEGGGERGAPCLVPLPLDGTRMFLKHQDDRSRAIQLATRDGATAVESLWDSGSISKTYSPAIHFEGWIYGFNGRALSCIDAKTGSSAWRSREPGDGFLAVLSGNLFVITKEGSAHLAKASSQGYQELASVKVFTDLCWAPPTVNEKSVFVRSLGEIARIDVRTGAPASAAPRESVSDLSGTGFGKLLEQIRGADDKTAVIDKYLKSITQFPIIESDGRVVFVYHGPAKDVLVGGDVTGFGAARPLTRVEGTDLFYRMERFEPDARVAYAFIRDFQTTVDPRNPRKYVNDAFDEELEFAFGRPGRELSWFSMPEWKPPTHAEPAEEARRGKLETQKVKSDAVKAEVELEVYLPVGYDKSTTPLPVVYVHDGQLARETLRLVNTLDNLVGRRIAPVIAVFIKHPAPLFTSPADYARMAAVELPAFIDSKYRTAATAEGRAHIGFGMSGFATMFTVLAHADKAQKLAVQSAFLAGTAETQAVMTEASRAPLTIYFDCCKYGLRNPLEGWNTVQACRDVDRMFRERGYKPAGGEVHDGSGPESWRNRTDEMLETLFPLKSGN